MANSLKITFTQPAVLNDHIEFKWNFYYDGSYGQATRGNTFKTTRVNPGEVAIGTNANTQALNYYNAFLIDYGVNFTVAILDNVVTITALNEDYISNFVQTGYTSFAYHEIITPPQSWIVSPYPADELAFTLDPKYFKFQTEIEDSYFQFDANIKTFDFFTNEQKENTIYQKVVPFKGQNKINLGQIIHRLMFNFQEVNENLEQYKYAILTIVCVERKISDASAYRSYAMPSINFIAGLSRGINNFGFLEFNQKPNRVTQNSFAYLNILIPSGNYELRTFKNGTLVNNETLPTHATTTLCKKVEFNAYMQGDIIDFVIDLIGEENENAPKKSFYLFPNGNFSNMIVWENEFKLQSAIECTGGAVIDPDLEFQSQKVYHNLVESLENLSSSKDVKFNIDTGWLLFSDIDSIESLMRGKRAWLVKGDKRISLRSIGKKLPKQDNETELISYPLEFTINRAYDEETYTL